MDGVGARLHVEVDAMTMTDKGHDEVHQVDRTCTVSTDVVSRVSSIKFFIPFSQFGCMGVQCNSHPHPHAPTRPASVKIRVIALDKS